MVKNKNAELTDEDLMSVYDVAWKQLTEDREALLDVYNELRGYVKDSPERYAISGETLAKIADLRVKQTSQYVELMKVLQKQKKEDQNLSSEDILKISEEIEKK